MMDIHHEQTETKGRYWAEVDGHTAVLTYSRVGRTQIIIDHTGVPDPLRGTGVGSRLVERAVRDAQRDGLGIIPLCPFAKGQIARNPHWLSW